MGLSDNSNQFNDSFITDSLLKLPFNYSIKGLGAFVKSKA
jgi:hypothetical protein